jgi:pimeloyl-ACP methyl ester carboxylesterase
MAQNPLFVASNDGTQIFAEAKGDPSNPCIVFLHGLSTGMGCFNNIFADPLWIARVFLVCSPRILKEY